MPLAARIGDPTSHGGAVVGMGVPTVLIEGKPAAVVNNAHVCPVPQPHPPSVFPDGSGTVRIGGRGALRVNDACGCGAQIVSGATKVVIGD